jgi:hypothetical protein
VIATKKGFNRDDAEARLRKAFNIWSPDVKFKDDEISRTMADAYFEVDYLKHLYSKETLAKYMKENYWDGESEYEKAIIKAIDSGGEVWLGNMPDGGEGGSALESVLRDAEISIYDEGVAIAQPFEEDEAYEKLTAWLDDSSAIKKREIAEILENREKADRKYWEAVKNRNDEVHAAVVAKYGDDPNALLKAVAEIESATPF